MPNGSTRLHHALTLKRDGSQNGESPENCGADEFRQGSGILPGDVARRVFGPNSERITGLEGGRPEIAKAQRKVIVAGDVPAVFARRALTETSQFPSIAAVPCRCTAAAFGVARFRRERMPKNRERIAREPPFRPRPVSAFRVLLSCGPGGAGPLGRSGRSVEKGYELFRAAVGS